MAGTAAKVKPKPAMRSDLPVDRIVGPKRDPIIRGSPRVHEAVSGRSERPGGHALASQRAVRHLLAMLFALLHIVLARALREHRRGFERIVRLKLTFHSDADVHVRHVAQGIGPHAVRETHRTLTP